MARLVKIVGPGRFNPEKVTHVLPGDGPGSSVIHLEGGASVTVPEPVNDVTLAINVALGNP